MKYVLTLTTICCNLLFLFSQKYEDEFFLREVLYDAVVMVEYSFLIPQIGIKLAGGNLKNLAVTWLFVADNAIRFVRYERMKIAAAMQELFIRAPSLIHLMI